MYVKVSALSRRNDDRTHPDKPNEDAYVADALHGIVVIADGVSAYCKEDAAYPTHYGGARAARILVAEIWRFLLANQARDVKSSVLLGRALQSANTSIDSATSRSHPPDYLCEFPGATATCVLIDGTTAWWAHLGDTVLLLIRKSGQAIPLCRNQLQEFSKWRKGDGRSLADLERADRFRTVHRDIRNRDLPYSYGVLNGEPEALRFVEVSNVTISAGDRLALLTDGFDNLWKDCNVTPYGLSTTFSNTQLPECQVTQLLYEGQLHRLIEEAVRADELSTARRSDDKTVVLIDFQHLNGITERRLSASEWTKVVVQRR